MAIHISIEVIIRLNEQFNVLVVSMGLLSEIFMYISMYT